MKKVILLLLFIPLFSFGQDYIKLSEIEIDEEMKLVEEIVKDKENQKLLFIIGMREGEVMKSYISDPNREAEILVPRCRRKSCCVSSI